MQKLIAEQEQRTTKKSKHMVLGLFLVLAILSVIRVALANRLVEDSSTLHTVDVKIAALEKENTLLAQEVREKSAIVLVEDKAEEKGFSKVKTYSYIHPEQPVAINTVMSSLR